MGAAESYRRHAPNAPIRILTADREPPYARPPLSKDYLRGDTDDVWLHSPDWYTERGIDVQLGVRVDSIDVQSHTLAARSDVHRYESLVLACGAAPTPLPVPGGHLTLALRSLTDAARLRRQAEDATSAVIIGAGFIGCEVAASLAMSGIAVTLVAPEAVPQLTRLGREAGERLLRLLEDSGVRYVGGAPVAAVEKHLVRLEDGGSIDCDLVVAATGVTPRRGLAENAGLDIREGRVLVGADMRTSAPDVYAVGDMALAFNAGARRHLAVEHWQDADDQGAIAGAGAAGAPLTWQGVPGFWSTIGDATVKYHAWGDGYDHVQMIDGGDGFTVWYSTHGTAVGVLTCNADDAYDAGERLIGDGRPLP